MKPITEWLQKATSIPSELYSRLITSLICIFVLWLFRWLILKRVWKRTENSRTRYQWRKISNYVAFTFAFLLIGRVWLEEFHTVTTFLGIVSAGLAIAMKDPLVNVAGWLFILWRRPFDVGDRIQIGDHAGDVIDMNVFHFTMMEIGSWVHADQGTGENRARSQRQGFRRSADSLHARMVRLHLERNSSPHNVRKQLEKS